MRKTLIALSLTTVLALTACTAAEEPNTPAPEPVTTTQAPEPPAEPEVYEASPEDVTIDLLVLESQCYGSAGCLVDVEPDVSINTYALDGVAFSVTFEVTGDESGTVVQTIEVDASGTYYVDSVYLSTVGADVKPEATVTRVTVN